MVTMGRRKHFDSKVGSVSRFIFAVCSAAAALKTDDSAFILAAIPVTAIALFLWTRNTRHIIEGTKIVIPLFAFIFVLHLFSHTGDTIFSIFFLHATLEGVSKGLFYGTKLIVFVFCALIILHAVDPFELVRPIERTAIALRRIGKPLSFMALALSLALRFIPELVRQGKTTVMALNTRGVTFEGGILEKSKDAVSLLVVMFVNAFKSAESASAALMVKGYSTRYVRAVLPPIRVTISGTLTLAVSAAILIYGWRT